MRRPYAIHLLHDQKKLLQFQQELDSTCVRPVAEVDSDLAVDVEEEWRSLKTDIIGVALRVLGFGGRQQLDWFLENRSVLEPLLATQRHARNRMLSQESRFTRSAYRSAQRAVSKAVLRANEEWIQRVAKDAENAGKDSCVRWKCIRKLQAVHAGRRHSTPSSVFNDNGGLTDSAEALRSS